MKDKIIERIEEHNKVIGAILGNKEIIEKIEDAIDRCEDVSDVLDDILMKSE